MLLLLLGTVFRLHQITTLPPGVSDDEIIDIRIAETARAGTIEVFYPLGSEGREGFYHIAAVLITSLVGNGPLGYRVFSVWAGLLAVALTYALGKRLFGPLAGLSAMALLAVTFWPVMLSRQITRETLLPLLIVYILFCLATALPVYRRRRKRGDNTSAAAALGALLGIILYVHPVGLLLLLSSMLFIAYMLVTRQQMSRRRLSYIGFALVLMIILAMPYLISTLRRPELSGVDRLTGTNYPWISLQAILDSIGGIAITGDANPLHNVPGLPLFDPLTTLFIVIGIVAAILGRRQPRHALLLIPLVILSPVFLFAANAPDFINYTPLLPLLALLFGLGLSRIAMLIPRFGIQIGLIVLTGIIILNTQRTIDNLFQTWPDLPEAQQVYNADFGQMARYIDLHAEDTPLVLCGWSFEQPPAAAVLTDAQTTLLMTNRKEAPIRQADCYNALPMTNGGAYQEIILPNPDALTNSHPQVREWLARSEPLTDHRVSLDVESALADRIGLLTVEAQVRYGPEAGTDYDTAVNTPVTFGGNLTFLGYVNEQTIYAPGENVEVITYWRVDGVVPPDLRLFTHILADLGASPPANRDVIHLEPGLLRNRDVFVHITYVPLPESLPPGEYYVSVGAYQDTSDDRLLVLDAGETRGSRLILYTITVEETTAEETP